MEHITITLAFIATYARKLYDQWNKWHSSDGPVGPWQGGVTKKLSDQLAIAIMEAVNYTSDLMPDGKVREVEPEARQLMLLFDRLGFEYKRWTRGAAAGHAWAHPAGSQELRDCFVKLHELMSTKRLPPPEPMAMLRDMGIPHRMIAIKYGWKQEDGTPDEMRVAIAMKDAEKFDREFDPSKWVHPAVAAIQADIDAQWASREPREQLFVKEPDPSTIPEPPSIEDMIRAKAPAQQIYNVHRKRVPELTIEFIVDMAKDMGIVLEGERYIVPGNQAVAISEAMAQAERVDAAKAKSVARLAGAQ